MKKKKLFESYSLKEMMAELSKVRCTEINGEKIVSEISKTQRTILKAFDLSTEMVQEHRY